MTHPRRQAHSTVPVVAAYPSADDIAARAHELFVAGGRRLRDIPEHWRTAEQELLDRAATRTVGRGGIPPGRSSHGHRRQGLV